METSSIPNQNTDINNFIRDASGTVGQSSQQAYNIPNTLQPVLITNPDDFAISTTISSERTAPVKVNPGTATTPQTQFQEAKSFALTNAYQTFKSMPAGATALYVASLTICGGRGVSLSDNGTDKFCGVLAGGFTNTDIRHFTFPIPIKFSTNIQAKSDANNTQDVTITGWYE